MNGKNNFKLIILLFITAIFSIAASFDIGITVVQPEVQYNLNQTEQLNKTVNTNGPNISIRIPLIYNLDENKNVNIEKPTGWTNGFNWAVFEEGNETIVTETQTHLFWEAKKDTIAVLEFEVLAPIIVEDSEVITIAYYEKNITVQAQNHFTNVSASTAISENHTGYSLYWNNGSDFIDKTNTFNLQIINNTAEFSGFHTSNQYFSIQGYCEENWVCEAWSGDDCGSRLCFDVNDCGTVINKPLVSKTCVVVSTSSGGSSSSSSFISTSTQEVEEETDTITAITMVPELITIEATKGEQKIHSIQLISKSNHDLTLTLDLKPEMRYLSLETNTIDIPANDKNSINLHLNVPEDASIGVDTYSFTIKFASFEKTITIVVSIIDEEIYGDVQIKNSNIPVGQEVVIAYKVLNFLKRDIEDAETVFYVKQNDDLLRILKRQTITIDKNSDLNQYSFSASDLKEGEFELCVDLITKDDTKTDCEKITITKTKETEETSKLIEQPKTTKTKFNFLFTILVILTFIIILPVILFIEYQKNHLFGIPKNITTKKQLIKYLERISEKTFLKHAGTEKNDFSDFVNYVFENEKLAKKINNLDKKDELIKALKFTEEEPQTKIQESEKIKKESKPESKQVLVEKETKETKQEQEETEEINNKPIEQLKVNQKFCEEPTDKNKYFYLSNKVILKSIADLESYLRVMPQEVFENHVSTDKNDFASWILGVFELPRLAKKISDSKTKEELISVLKEEVNENL